MAWRRLSWVCALGLALGSTPAQSRGEETTWRAATGTGSLPPADTASAPVVSLGRPRPLAELAPPVPLAAAAAAPRQDSALAPASYEPATGLVVRGQAAEPPPPPPPPPAGGDLFHPGAAPVGQGWWDRCKGWFDFSKHE